MMFRKKIFLYFLFFIAICRLLTSDCFSQHNNFHTYSIENGLPQSNVYCMMQDSRGYLWVGTGGGVARFDGNSFFTFGKKDGLAGNTIRSLLEDSKGNIWIGTDEGISIYNGVKFKNITKENGLSGSSALKLLEDDAHNIWVGTDDGGLNEITFLPLSFGEGQGDALSQPKGLRSDSFSISIYSDKNGLSSNTIFDIYQDKEKRLWIATYGGGINIFTHSKDSFDISVLHGGREIPSDMILSIEEDTKGNIWFGTYDAGVFKITKNKDGSTGEVKRYNFFNGFPANLVWDILSDNKTGELWFGTGENGVCRMKNDSANINFISYNIHHGLPNNTVLCLLQDNEKNVWFGTNGDGLSKLSGDHFSHYSEKDGLSKNIVQSITQDKEGNYWFATYGGGLTKMSFNGNNPISENFTTKQGLASDYLSSVAMGKHTNDYLWIGTTNHGIAKYDGKKFISFSEGDGLVSSRVNCVYVDSKGIVWCCTANGISRYDGVKILNVPTEKMMMNDDGVKTVIEDKKGNLWFGTAGGLARYSGNSTMRTFDEMEGLHHKDVNAITEDINGNIWIGTNGGGIYMFDINAPDSNAIHFIANDSLLVSNIVVSLKFIDDKTLIACTYKGFDKITFSSSGSILAVKHYGSSDGFVGVECSDNAIYRDKSGNIWIGTAKGVTSYNPSLERINDKAPRTHITGIKQFFKDVDWKTKSDSILPWFNLPSTLELRYSENHFTFEFTGISFTNPAKVLYSYKLEGLENEWSPPRKENTVTYSGLAPEQYTFVVIAVTDNGMLGKPATFTFIINPPWWRTWWFYTICTVFIIALVVSYVKIREKKLKEEKQILENLVTERTKEVVHQKEVIEEKNKDITDSITYAQGIQQAILPPDDRFKKYLPDSFILFRPRDIVSGDFYWMEVAPLNPQDTHTQAGSIEHGKLPPSGGGGATLVLFAVCDCTGHGVPGGFVSMVGHNGLTRTVKEQGIIHPSKILDRAAILVEETFSKGKRKDGMDAVLCGICIQSSGANPEIEFAGANNPLYFVRRKENGMLTENGQALTPDCETETHWLFQVIADKQPVGAYEYRKPFTNHNFNLLPGDTVYLSSDGYRDQFGGQKGKKFMARNFKQILVSFQDKTMEEQKEILDKTIKDWMSGFGQNDDICVIGVRV